MDRIASRYRPITATPFLCNATYCERSPGVALAPYICCFWGTPNPITPSVLPTQSNSGLVIPDTCMDIIFSMNHESNQIEDTFCTIDEHSYRTEDNGGSNHITSTFAIRFYAWTAILFSENGMENSQNQIAPTEAFFPTLKKLIIPILQEETSLTERIRRAEPVLLRLLRQERMHSDLLNAIDHIIQTKGRARISELRSYVAVSGRQLERLFQHHTGVSPKTFSSLVRYQMLWQDMVFSPGFSTLDAVEKYGYTDQAHLLKDFQRRHLMSPRDAIAFTKKQR